MKKEMTTTEVKYIDGTFVVKVRGLNIDNYFLNRQLPLNEDGNILYGQLDVINYKRTVRKLHDAGWKNSFSPLLMFLCLVMDMVCLSILNL